MRTAHLRVVSGGGGWSDQVPGGGGGGGVTKSQVGGEVVEHWCCPPPHPPRWTEWVTHACKNITFARFATRAVTMTIYHWHMPLIRRAPIRDNNIIEWGREVGKDVSLSAGIRTEG